MGLTTGYRRLTFAKSPECCRHMTRFRHSVVNIMHSSLTQFNVLSSGYYGISLCVIQPIIIIIICFPNL